MRHILLAWIIPFLTISPVVAQENKVQDQKPTAPPATSETEKPKTEVDQMLEDLAKRGEPVLGTCLVDDCGEPSASGVENGKVIQLAKPVYPRIARMANVEGSVDVQVIIGEEGKVIAAAAIAGHPLLFGASVAAARESVFTPTRLNGKPVKVVGVIKYNFVPQ